MKECKAKRAGKKPALRVAHRNDRAAVTRWMAGQGQALLPMLELLDNASHRVRATSTSRGLVAWACF